MKNNTKLNKKNFYIVYLNELTTVSFVLLFIILIDFFHADY